MNLINISLIILLAFLSLMTVTLSAQSPKIFQNENGKYGLKDAKGVTLLAATYDELEHFSPTLAFVEQNHTKGVVNFLTGKEYFFERYEDVLYANTEIVLVRDSLWRWFFWTEKSGIETDKYYDHCTQINSRHYVYSRNGLLGLLDNQLNEITPAKYTEVGGSEIDDISKEYNGLVAVSIGEENNAKWGYIDTLGKEVIPTVFDRVTNFYSTDPIAFVRSHGLWGVINTKGEFVLPLSYSGWDTGHAGENFIWVQKDEKWGTVDRKTGLEIITPKYDVINSFNLDEWSAPVSENGKYGYVGVDGSEVISPRFNLAAHFSEGYAAVSNGSYDENYNFIGKWGYIDKSGEIVIPMIYDVAGDFYDGHAQVVLNGKIVHINKKGKKVTLKE